MQYDISNPNPMPTTLIQALNKYRTILFCGLAKNTGKTVALRQAMLEARRAGKSISVTSIGRDGEAFDAIYTELAKPLLYFELNDIVVTSEQLLPDARTFSIMHRFNIHSQFGELVAIRISDSCHFEVAGPSTVSELRTIQSWFMAVGIDLLLIDGAIDRKAASLPDICDGLVLSSGAAVSERMADVIKQTVSSVDMLRAQLRDYHPKTEKHLFYSPIFDSEKKLQEILTSNAKQPLSIEIKGAITEPFLNILLNEKIFSWCRIEVDCFAKVCVRPTKWAEYRRHGLIISYKRNTHLLALTINPISPKGTFFDSNEFLNLMRRSLPEIPVFDVCSPTYPGIKENLN